MNYGRSEFYGPGKQDSVRNYVILYIEDVDLNTVYVSPLIGVPGHPLH